MKSILLFIISFSAHSAMIPLLRGEGPDEMTRAITGGGAGGAINKDFLRGAGVTILLDMVSNTGWEIVKKAAALGNEKAQAMLKKYEDKVRQNIRDIQERDRLRDIREGNFDSPRVRMGHGHGRAVPIAISKPEL